MRYRITASVVGRLFFPRRQTTMSSTRGDLVLDLLADQTGHVTHIQLTKVIPSDIAYKYFSTAEQGADGMPLFEIHGEKHSRTLCWGSSN